MAKLKLIVTLGVLFALLNLQGDGGALAVIWPCESDADCTADGSSCGPDSSQCECSSFDTVFSENFTQCLKSSQIGDACQDSVQCNLMPTGASCKTGVCDCADGQTYLRGKCRPLNGLNEPCETDLECFFGYDRASVSCQENVCACANGYYHRYGNICRRKSMEKNDACVVNEDCDALGASAACVGLVCTIVDETITSTTTTEGTTEGTTAGTTAGTETTADDIETTETEPNTDTTEPDFPVTTIIPNSFVPSRKQFAKAYVHASPTHKDASAQATLSLTNGDSEVLLTPRRSREIAVQTSIEKYELKELGRSVKNAATTTTTTSTSVSSRHTSTNTQNNRRRLPAIFRYDNEDIKTYSTLGSSRDDDDADDKKYGSSCTDNGKSCAGLAHSICTNKICLCRQGFYARNGKCFAELGEIAESSDECEYEFDQLSKTCICQKNYFYERDLRNCRKPIQYHLSCTSNSQCSPFGASYCHSQIPRRCTCEEYAQYNEISQLCEYKDGLGAECESNDGCLVDHSICSNRFCVCQDHYFEKDEACVAGIGADCSEDDECGADNTACLERSNSTSIKDSEQTRSCQCRKGYVHFKDECLKEAEELDDECIEDEQCKPLLASCNTEGKCGCSEEQHEKNGICETKRLLGEPCNKATECFVEKDPENVECRNSVCQCKFSYQASTDQKQCIRVLPNKKNSSGRPSALKIITFVLIGSAFLITSAAIKQAYY
ncbi:prion-like-(Q/N-rich) domain-bearing protein 25 [Drosophila innubila]|uniref:prion-like-(Q/N-rich) domain-bearing protein 25 n=1 Tax=Drosophila innubila TaxID=198719 RepID=UPI00148E6E10|nr:prion-like-(Q/N-rich) domain-bearing protein 25 [Drosophila innubila]